MMSCETASRHEALVKSKAASMPKKLASCVMLTAMQ